MSRMKEKQSNKTFRKLIIIAIFLVCILIVLKYANNYIRKDITNQINLVVNNSNVTKSLKKPIFIENGVVYVSKEDISNFFDPYIYYEEKYNQIITGSETKIAAIVIGQKQMTNNGAVVSIPATVLEKDNTYYIPFSALDNIYNVKTTYIEGKDIVTVDSLDRKFIVADSNKDSKIKQERTDISRTVDKVKRGDNLIVVPDSSKDGWVRVRTENGKLGYVREKNITNQTTVRENMETKEKIEGNISMIWDYFTQWGSAPSRTEPLKGVNVVSPTFFTLKRLRKRRSKCECRTKWQELY